MGLPRNSWYSILTIEFHKQIEEEIVLKMGDRDISVYTRPVAEVANCSEV
jgi:hypothetical protein